MVLFRKNKSLYEYFKNFINFLEEKQKIETKSSINVNKIISSEHENKRQRGKLKNNII